MPLLTLAWASRLLGGGGGYVATRWCGVVWYTGVVCGVKCEGLIYV